MKIARMIVVAAALLLVVAPVSQAAGVKLGTVVAPFTLQDIDGKDHTETYDNKVNIVTFWVSSCSLCKEELKILNGLVDKYKGEDLGITVVSTDFGGPRVVKWVLDSTNTEPKVPILFDSNMKVARDEFGTVSFPHLFLLDKGGKVVFYIEGFEEDSEDRLISEINFRLKK